MNFEESDLSEREKVALRYADLVKYNPQGVTDEFMDQVKQHFTDGEICEIGYILMAYGGAHNFLSSIGEDVVDENGVSLVSDDGMFGKDGFPLVFNTRHAQTVFQAPEEMALDGPLPPVPFMTDVAAPQTAPERPSSAKTEKIASR